MAKPVSLRFGRRRADGSVRFVVRPIEWLWFGIMAAVAIGFMVFIAIENPEVSWLAHVIWPVLPLAVTWREGFDIRVRDQSIRGWKAFGPITYGSFTVSKLKMPEVSTRMETHTNSEGGESRGRVTRLHWGRRNLRAGMKREALNALLAEARAVAAEAAERGA